MSYPLEAVWPTPPENVREEVVRFWTAEDALPSRSAAEERAHQLLVVARAPSGCVAGVSTAVRTLIPQLGFECFFYRTFIGRAHRVWGLLIWDILLASYHLLNERFRDGCDPNVLGMYAELENPSLMRSLKDVVWHKGDFVSVYIGRRQDGRHMRVSYFDGAWIP